MTFTTISAVCPLAAGTQYPPATTTVTWNEYLEEDFTHFLDKKLFTPIIEQLPGIVQRITGLKVQKVSVSTGEFNFKASADTWALQEDGWIATKCTYTEGKVNLDIDVVIDGVNLSVRISDLFWTPSTNLVWRLETATRELARKYREAIMAEGK